MIKAMGVLQEMKRDGLEPTQITYNSLAKGWCDAKDMVKALEVVDTLRANRMQPDVITWTTLVRCIFYLRVFPFKVRFVRPRDGGDSRPHRTLLPFSSSLPQWLLRHR